MSDAMQGGASGGSDYLVRNAEVVDVSRARDQGSESWDRAVDGRDEMDVDEVAWGRWQVEFPDGDPHEVLLVETGDDQRIGSCDCDGWRFHDSPCAHLCALSMHDALHGVVPASKQPAQTLLENDE